jgi:urea carboxylase
VFTKVLIANRGAIACRVERTLRRMGVASVAVFSEADAGSLHVSQADEAVCIGPAPAARSYLDVDALLGAARATGAQAIHPGYGFLSENASFAQRCEDAGIAFIGPTPANIRAFGLKHTARRLAREQAVPLMPGTDLLRDAAAALAEADRIGFPVMLKSTAGGGGIGMRVCEDRGGLAEAYAAVGRIAGSNFGDAGVFLERYVRHARHIEVQVFGDGRGTVTALGERDCSLQRRHQKVIEETPAPHLPPATRAALLSASTRLCAAAAYRSAGTVEFLYDAERDEFYFLEVNTRLQVEHGVTEQVTGIDLVEWMVRGAAGDFSFMPDGTVPSCGASIQARLYAEDPGQDYRPSSGVLTSVAFPADARVDTWVAAGTEVSAHYDPLLAKLIVSAPDRAGAVQALRAALAQTRLGGLETNLEWLQTVVQHDFFTDGTGSTRSLGTVDYEPGGIRVLAGGLATTVQDYPGRIGYWNVGVPPSGPMDTLAFRLGNRLLGNDEGAAGLEITAVGPALHFHRAARVCLTGAELEASVDGTAVEPYRVVPVAAGQILRIGSVRGTGLRAYLLVEGGLDVPPYLGSRATFTLGQLGGHAGRALVSGDVLRPGPAPANPAPERRLDPALRPALAADWTLRVLYGPHGAPDFFTAADIDAIESVAWQVHHNSSRTGVRLIGPKPQWARRDGGEAGLHPSNIHDNPYAVGAIDFTGDMPIILGPDGPSLGGFVCPFVIIQADQWKIGQLVPGNTVRFERVEPAQARALEAAQDALVRTLGAAPGAPAAAPSTAARTPVLAALDAQGARPAVVYRRQGERYLLVEYGPIVLDLELRLRVHALMLWLQHRVRAGALAGVIDITPGIRSLQIHFDGRVLPEARLLQALADAEDNLGGLDGLEIPSRVVHLPLSWNDPAIGETVQRYMSSVRSDAPWCPDNIEFIRRVNGLDGIEDVRRTVFDASYLVLGLGDVYLGAPVATPLDPRHRLVTTKYNPARTWTPPNVVGIGGAYLCIYGMEGPGGYQLFGRTIQVWNTYGRSASFADGKPWLLRFFDQIRFFPVSHEELAGWRRDFPYGRRRIEVEAQTFRLADYRAFLAANATSIAQFQARRQAAFEAERAQWEAQNEFARAESLEGTHAGAPAPARIVAPEGAELIEAPLSGVVWKTEVQPGARVEKGAVLVSIEAMKMQCDVPSHAGGIVRAVYVQPGQAVQAGAPIVALEHDGAHDDPPVPR